MSEVNLNVEIREDLGKGASRRLRRLENKVPAVLYGGKKDCLSLQLLQKDVLKAIEDDSIFSALIHLKMGDKATTALIKDIQRHPARVDQITHIDFQRVDAETPVIVTVPIKFINEDTCIGVKQQGGAISRKLSQVEIRCLPKYLPENIQVDVANVSVKQSLRLSDIPLPEGVELTALKRGSQYDVGVVSVISAKKRA